MIVSGANVLITGGASGIGEEFAVKLAEMGARVWVVDRDPDALQQLEARAILDRGRLIVCDVGIEEQVVATVQRIERQTEIDVLINNAAELRDQTLASKLGKRVRKHSTEDWEATIRSNLTGTFLMAREVAGAMIAGRRKGLIVNMSSVVHVGNPGQSAYSATKGGIEALTVTWSQELAPYGIRVAAIAPGFVETRLTRSIPPLFLEKLVEKTPLHRYGRLEELSRALIFVIEDEYFHGKTLEVDGGLRF